VVTLRSTASAITAATVPTKVKSRVCSPSPWTGSGCHAAPRRRRWHHRRVGVPRRLQRPEHVEEPERERRQVVAVLVGQRVGLGGELADRVGRQRLGPQVLRLRQGRVRAVHRRGRGHAWCGRCRPAERPPAPAACPWRWRRARRPAPRPSAAPTGPRPGARSRRPRRTRVQQVGVQDAADEQLGLGQVGQVVSVTGRQVVDDHHLVDRVSSSAATPHRPSPPRRFAPDEPRSPPSPVPASSRRKPATPGDQLPSGRDAPSTLTRPSKHCRNSTRARVVWNRDVATATWSQPRSAARAATVRASPVVVSGSGSMHTTSRPHRSPSRSPKTMADEDSTRTASWRAASARPSSSRSVPAPPRTATASGELSGSSRGQASTAPMATTTTRPPAGA
jgi:hypothetical protein